MTARGGRRDLEAPPAPKAMAPRVLLGELGVGLALLAAAAIAGFLLVHRPWPNRLDAAGFTLLPASPSSRLYNDIARIGSLPFLAAGVLVAAFVSVWRDLPRALASIGGPLVAVFVTEWVAKPLVGRHAVLGGNSYPSGTVTAAVAMITVLLLAAPRMLRIVLVLPACGVVIAVSAAVVGMRWHYPTDTLGGICVGLGTVLLVDGALHVPGLLVARHRSTAYTRPTRYEDTGPFVAVPH